MSQKNCNNQCYEKFFKFCIQCQKQTSFEFRISNQDLTKMRYQLLKKIDEQFMTDQRRFNVGVGDLSYKTNQKYFGTVFFEQMYSQELGQEFLDKVLVYNKKDFNIKFKQFLKYEKLKFNHSCETIYKLMEHFKNFIQVQLPKQKHNKKKREEMKSEEKQIEDDQLFKKECLITQEL